jgi:hypothetical protein
LKKRYFILIIVFFVVLFPLVYITKPLFNSSILPSQARKIAINAAKPPKDLPSRNQWELRQVSDNVKPTPFWYKSQMIKAYKINVYYVDDEINMAYYGRTVVINANNGKILKMEKAPYTRY